MNKKIYYVQIKNMRLNKESKKYNKVLEEYKSRLKESNKTAMENKFMRSVIYINGEPNEIRDTFNYLINIFKEKAINYEDTYNLEKLLKEKDDKELLKYFLKNEIGTDGLAGQYFKNIYRS